MHISEYTRAMSEVASDMVLVHHFACIHVMSTVKVQHGI
jgi:hypothetical protein